MRFSYDPIVPMKYVKSAAFVATILLIIPTTVQWREIHRLRAVISRSEQQREDPAARIRGKIASPSEWLDSPARPPLQPGTMEDASVESDLATAVRHWELSLCVPDIVRRSQRTSQLVGSLTSKTAPAVAIVFRQMETAGLKFPDEFRLFLRAWGQLDGAAAVKYARECRGSNADFSELLAAIAGWASVNPRSVYAWIETQEESARGQLVHGLIDGWSTVDYEAAAAYAEAYASSCAGVSARERFGPMLLQRGQQWVAGIPSDEQHRIEKQRAFSLVIEAMIDHDAGTAANWISLMSEQPFLTGYAISRIARKLGETSPKEALGWLDSIRSEEASSVAIVAGTILSNWACQDMVAAGTWLGQNMNHPHYDWLAQYYAWTIGAMHPDAAAAWRRTIRDELIREAATSMPPDHESQRRYKLALKGEPPY